MCKAEWQHYMEFFLIKGWTQYKRWGVHSWLKYAFVKQSVLSVELKVSVGWRTVSYSILSVHNTEKYFTIWDPAQHCVAVEQHTAKQERDAARGMASQLKVDKF